MSERPTTSFVATIRAQCERRGDAVAFHFLPDGEVDQPIETVSAAALDARARAIAARLALTTPVGARALLLFAPGLDFIAAFLGCLYAGVIAVPAYPPDPTQLERTLPRIRAIVRDSGAALVLTTSPIARLAAGMQAVAAELASLPAITVDTIPAHLARGHVVREPVADAIAFLQYTSGSTATPRGVMVTHQNLLHNSRAIQRAGRVTADTVAVNWLPSYHDMGLIGAILQPLFSGFPGVLIPPHAFLRRPLRWLEAITRFRGTASAFPNFALDLCARKVSDAELARLDLRSWESAWNGAEPIRAASLERFAARFAACGLRRAALFPVYGLAEATLFVTGARDDQAITTRTVSRRDLARHRVSPAIDGDAITLVGCGGPIDDTEVVIVEPNERRQVAPGEVGEIWVRGPSVAAGYWGRDAETGEAFHAHLAGRGDGPFLRTGDLGFVDGGQLFVTGRRKDLIVLRGANLYPQDVELAIEPAHPAIRAGSVAAFAIDGDDGEALAVMIEVRDGLTDDELAALPHRAREAAFAAVGFAPRTVALLAAGGLPKTSSGKIQRFACRDGLVHGTLPTLLVDVLLPAPAATSAASLAQDQVLEVMARITGYPRNVFALDARLGALGLDSLQVHECSLELEQRFGPTRGPIFTDASQTVGDVVRACLRGVTSRAESVDAVAARAPTSPSQRSITVDTREATSPSQRSITVDAREPATECSQCESNDVVDAPLHDLNHAHSPRHDSTSPSRQETIADFPELRDLRATLARFEASGLGNPYGRDREALARESASAGRELIDFTSFDYLGLARDPRVAAAATRAIAAHGTSASASRVAWGECEAHRAVERALAAFLGCDGALVMPSGHATNVATIAALVGPGDLIVHDSLAHDSLLTGARLSGARRVVFPHNDLDALERALVRCRGDARRALIVVEGAYSMDGDLAPLRELVAIKRRHGALLYVDEAHSIGVVGATGRGLAEHAGVARGDVDVWMGTLSKALASCGGYVAGERGLIDLLRYRSGGFVFATAIAPAAAAAAGEALRILAEEPERVARVQANAARFVALCRARGVDTGRSAGTPIVPVIVGDSSRCLRVSEALRRRGVNAPPIVHPAVEEHLARLRFFVGVRHTEAHLEAAADAIASALAGPGERRDPRTSAHHETSQPIGG